jgi:aspartate racemase
MEEDFYNERLRRNHGLDVLVPDREDRDVVHRVIYDELCLGKVLPDSRSQYRRIMARMIERGAQAIILGCTEISLLVGDDDATVPLFDTTRIHAESAALHALDE